MSDFIKRIKPVNLIRKRGEIVADVITREPITSGDAPPPEPTLCEWFFIENNLSEYVKYAAELSKHVPANMSVLANSLLYWHVRNTDESVVLLPATKVDAPTCTDVFAVYICELEPSHESQRVYESRFGALPMGALSLYSVYGTNEPITNNGARSEKKRWVPASNDLAVAAPTLPLVGGSGGGQTQLTETQLAERAAIAKRLKTGGARLADTLRSKQPVALEMLGSDALDSKVPALTRWRVATVANDSFTVLFKLHGYLHRDFVRQRGMKLRIRDREFYYLQSDSVSQFRTQPLLPIPIVVQSPLPLVEPVTDVVTVVNNNDDFDLLTLDTPVAHALATTPPPTRPVHILERLKKFKLDTQDVADFEEIDAAAYHLLRVLFAICDYCEKDEDDTDEDSTDDKDAAAATTPDAENKDHMIVHCYPHGYLAPRSVRYVGAPGLRSLARATDYTALGLGVLCLVVRHDTTMLRWLLYAESLRLAHNSAQPLDIRWHLEGIERFVAHTREPDADRHAQLAGLVYELRKKIAKRVPVEWQKK